MGVRHQLGEAEGGVEVDELGKPVLEVVHAPGPPGHLPAARRCQGGEGANTGGGVCERVEGTFMR